MSNHLTAAVRASVATALAAAVAPAVFAGQIDFITPVADPGIYSIAGQGVSTVTINNDNVDTVNPNGLFVLQKDYVAVGAVDIVLSVSDTGGVTEYVVTENVQNSTGVDWNGYRILLGFGFGASFVQSTPGDGLDFDTPDEDSPINFAPGAADFTTVTRPNEDELVASDGDLLAGQFSGTDFVFHIDVPDGITEFTIRQQPIAVPEPGALALAVVAAPMVLRRRQSSRAAG